MLSTPYRLVAPVDLSPDDRFVTDRVASGLLVVDEVRRLLDEVKVYGRAALGPEVGGRRVSVSFPVHSGAIVKVVPTPWEASTIRQAIVWVFDGDALAKLGHGSVAALHSPAEGVPPRLGLHLAGRQWHLDFLPPYDTGWDDGSTIPHEPASEGDADGG